MPNPYKRKGDSFEREVVKAALAAGLEARRAYGSDGRSLPGCTSDVDVLVEGYRLQAKRRRHLAGWTKPPPGCHATVLREDRGEAVVLLRLDEYLRLIGAIAKVRKTRRTEGGGYDRHEAAPGAPGSP